MAGDLPSNDAVTSAANSDTARSHARAAPVDGEDRATCRGGCEQHDAVAKPRRFPALW